MTGILANAISIAWNPSPSPDVEGYIVGVWQYGYSSQWTHFYLPANQNFFLLQGLTPGAEYAFIVEAYNAVGYSSWSNQVNQYTHRAYP